MKYRVRCTAEASVTSDDSRREQLQRLLGLMRRTLIEDGYSVMSVEILRDEDLNEGPTEAAPSRGRSRRVNE